MSNILEQMLKASKEQLELEFEHKKELAQIKSCQNNEIKELKQKYKDKISDLEAKLAESEKSEETYKSMFEIGVENNHSLLKEIEQLKQQLVEKYKENELMAKTLKLTKFVEKEVNQEKISFAVEKLEKVKELLLESLYDLYSKPSEIWDKYGDLYDVVVEGAVNGTIDNQIKQLKEGK